MQRHNCQLPPDYQVCARAAVDGGVLRTDLPWLERQQQQHSVIAPSVTDSPSVHELCCKLLSSFPLIRSLRHRDAPGCNNCHLHSHKVP